jgi:hypothetical protein
MEYYTEIGKSIKVRLNPQNNTYIAFKPTPFVYQVVINSIAVYHFPDNPISHKSIISELIFIDTNIQIEDI